MAYYAIKPSSSPSKMLLCLTKKLALRSFLNELDLSQGNRFELMASGSWSEMTITVNQTKKISRTSEPTKLELSASEYKRLPDL